MMGVLSRFRSIVETTMKAHSVKKEVDIMSILNVVRLMLLV